MTERLSLIDAIKSSTERVCISLIVLDSSTSMRGIAQATQSCVNGVLNDLRVPKDQRQQFVKIVTFADSSSVHMPLQSADGVKDFTTYHPSGNTRLWQTVDEELKLLLEEFLALPAALQQKTRVVVGVFTDGDDNIAQRSEPGVYPKKLQTTAAEVIDEGFVINTYGIGRDAAQLAQRMGFNYDADHAISVEASAAGVRRASAHHGYSSNL